MSQPHTLDVQQDQHVQPDGHPTDRVGQAWALVSVREILVKLRDRNFLIGTGVTLLILIGMLGFNAYLASRETRVSVAVTDQSAAAIVESVAQAYQARDSMTSVNVATYPDDASARQAVGDDAAQAYLHRGPQGWTLTSADPVDSMLESSVAQAVRAQVMQQNLAAAGTSWQQVNQGADLNTDLLAGSHDAEAAQATVVKVVTGVVFAILFYMAALMFGMGIAQSVVEEKQSRVVEILATAIPIRQLLIGKVLGNTALAMAQMVLFLGVGLIGLTFTTYSSYLSMISGPTTWFLVFFLVGFLSLACVWAVAGSLASRSEDLQSTTMPMTFVLIVVLFAGLSVTGTWLVITSYLPVFSTITMPIRLMDGSAAWWEAAVSLIITIGFAFFTIIVGERLYRRSVMRTGGRITLRQTLKAAD